MPLQDPNNHGFLMYLLVVVIALWGGTASYIGRIKRGLVSKFSIAEWIGELVISGFSGVVVFWLCQAVGVDELLMAVCVAVAGHAGGRMIFFIEQVMMKRLERISKSIDG